MVFSQLAIVANDFLNRSAQQSNTTVESLNDSGYASNQVTPMKRRMFHKPNSVKSPVRNLFDSDDELEPQNTAGNTSMTMANPVDIFGTNIPARKQRHTDCSPWAGGDVLSSTPVRTQDMRVTYTSSQKTSSSTVPQRLLFDLANLETESDKENIKGTTAQKIISSTVKPKAETKVVQRTPRPTKICPPTVISAKKAAASKSKSQIRSTAAACKAGKNIATTADAVVTPKIASKTQIKIPAAPKKPKAALARRPTAATAVSRKKNATKTKKGPEVGREENMDAAFESAMAVVEEAMDKEATAAATAEESTSESEEDDMRSTAPSLATRRPTRSAAKSATAAIRRQAGEGVTDAKKRNQDMESHEKQPQKQKMTRAQSTKVKAKAKAVAQKRKATKKETTGRGRQTAKNASTAVAPPARKSVRTPAANNKCRSTRTRRPAQPTIVKSTPKATPKTTAAAARRVAAMRARRTQKKVQKQSMTINEDPTALDRSMELAQEALHMASCPKTLPCREQEFDHLYQVLLDGLCDPNAAGTTVYIAGTPGTGKTATVHAVLRQLRQQAAAGEIPHFNDAEINGLNILDARQTYCALYDATFADELAEQTERSTSCKGSAREGALPTSPSPTQALALLRTHYTTVAPKRRADDVTPTILVLDELDQLVKGKQELLYNIFEWPHGRRSGLIVIGIANALDMPERLMHARIASRIGACRIKFSTYNADQLEKIITERLKPDSECFDSDDDEVPERKKQNLSVVFEKEAISACCRKIASLSGDARRVLDIMRKAATLAQSRQAPKVTTAHFLETYAEMTTSPAMQAVRESTLFEQLVLVAGCDLARLRGLQDFTFSALCDHALLLARKATLPFSLPQHQLSLITYNLVARGLLHSGSGSNALHVRLEVVPSPMEVLEAVAQAEPRLEAIVGRVEELIESGC
eukprot:Clim_evm46s202 gene=Clim_evmTU46s202